MTASPAETNRLPAAPWLTAAALDGHAIDPRQRAWLQWPGLLTAALRRASGPAFRLELLGQRPIVLDEAERIRLGTRDGEALCREIVMGDGACDYVCARTLVPGSTLAAHPWLGELGRASLGERLREVGQPSRDPFRFRAMRPDEPLLSGLARPPKGAIWARDSVFRIDGLALSVLEAFLPDLSRCPAPRGE